MLCSATHLIIDVSYGAWMRSRPARWLLPGKLGLYFDNKVVTLDTAKNALIFFLFLNSYNPRSCFHGADPEFRKSGFLCLKVRGFALLILSQFSQISHDNDIIWSHFIFIGYFSKWAV